MNVKNQMSNNRIPLEKKMELAQYIRNENLGNRMQIRQREKIIYGTERELPLIEYTENSENKNVIQQEGSFKFRMVAAVLLFAAFLLCDAGNYKLFGYSMNDICSMISEDYFQMYATNAEENVTSRLTGLLQLDFEK